MSSPTANLPIRWFKGIPTTYWEEQPFRVAVHLWKGRFRYKITCLECRKNRKGEAFTMQIIVKNWKELLPCQH